MPPSTGTADGSAPPLGKYLASNEKKQRDKAIKSLAAFLSSEKPQVLDKVEMAKLWKGIFYCFWMSDKPLVQQALANELAELVLSVTPSKGKGKAALPNAGAWAFVDGFWEAMTREWSGIDRLRLDKFYMLIRRYVNATFRLLARGGYNEKELAKHVDVLSAQGRPLCWDDPRVPTSLAYHLADVYLQELEKAIASRDASEDDEEGPKVPLIRLLEPFSVLLANTSNNTTYNRVSNSLFSPLLSALSPPAPSRRPSKRRKTDTAASSDEDESPYPALLAALPAEHAEIRRGVVRALFEEASKETAREANRRKIYALWKEELAGEEEEEDGEDVSGDEGEARARKGAFAESSGLV